MAHLCAAWLCLCVQFRLGSTGERATQQRADCTAAHSHSSEPLFGSPVRRSADVRMHAKRTLVSSSSQQTLQTCAHTQTASSSGHLLQRFGSSLARSLSLLVAATALRPAAKWMHTHTKTDDAALDPKPCNARQCSWRHLLPADPLRGRNRCAPPAAPQINATTTTDNRTQVSDHTRVH